MINMILGAVLDFILGDPYSFPHPVRLFGDIISLEEKIVRRVFKSKGGLRFGGLVLSFTNILLGFLVPFILLRLLRPYSIIHRIFSIYFIYTCLAARSLDYEAKMVLKALDEGLSQGRRRLSYIVGRDTSNLGEEEIIKATVETVSENTSDGIIGPLFYIAILGPGGGMAYKFVNTMDSMLGYMNDKYRDLGYFPAKLDDLINLIPARITGLFMILSSLGKYNLKSAFKVFLRDKRNHKSPNSGYPESATAGLLGIELGGGNYYQGVYVEKPSIGDPINLVNKAHISQAVGIMYRTEVLFLLLIIFVYFLRGNL